MDGRLKRLVAFTSDPAGGNPAGVWIDDELPAVDEMQSIAAQVGYSETVFAAPREGMERTVRYFSPLAEVPFCGHATIALGVSLGSVDGPGQYRLHTKVGQVTVVTETDELGVMASLTSVEPSCRRVEDELLARALFLLSWQEEDLAPDLRPALAYAGAHHLVLATATHQRLQNLDYDFEGLKQLMLEEDLTTLQLVWRKDPTTFHARNPFPVGGIVEDPATGAAAAALGGYLRHAGLVTPPCEVTVLQGEDMGRPSRLTVSIPQQGGIVVKGRAVAL